MIFMRNFIRTACLCFALLGNHSFAKAQSDSPRPSEPGKSPRDSFRPERPFGAGNGPMANRFGPGFERLLAILTEEQKSSLRDSMNDQREKSRELEMRALRARKELFEASIAQNFDEEAVRQKATAAGKVEAELMVVRAKALSRVRPPISPDQLEQLRQGFPGNLEPSGERPRRPQPPRDENGLPPKDAPPRESSP
jgi:Spy/CpxP family protein refolding chaperone